MSRKNSAGRILINGQEIDFSLVEIYLTYSGHIFLRITEEYIENAT